MGESVAGRRITLVGFFMRPPRYWLLASSRMGRVEEHERERPERKHRQPGRQGGREVLMVAEVLAGEGSGVEKAAQDQAQAGADENVPVLVAEDGRQAQ